MLGAAVGAAGRGAGFLAADLTACFGTAVAGAAVAGAPAAGAPSEELELSLLLLLSELDELSSFAPGFAGLTAATRVPVLFLSGSFFLPSFSVDAVPSFFFSLSDLSWSLLRERGSRVSRFP